MITEGTLLEEMRIGLCLECSWVRPIGNDRGSVFYLCGRAKQDLRFPKYPRLPVLHCAGFSLKDSATDTATNTDSPQSVNEVEPGPS